MHSKGIKNKFTQIVSGLLLASVLLGTFAPATPALAQSTTGVTPVTGTATGGIGTSPATATNNAFCDSLASCIAAIVYVFTAGIGSAVAYLAANFLSYAAHVSLNSGAYAITFIAEGWTMVRDIANMAFIFILIYLALTVMFQASTAHTMQTLALVIAMALVINFSFFITRVVIDAGNILAVQFYNAIISGNQFNNIQGTNTPDLTTSIMQGLNIQTILNSNSFDRFRNLNEQTQGGIGAFLTELISLIFIYIAMGVIFFVLAATFMVAGIKFLTRIVILWLTIIAAPAALVARTLHPFEKYYKMWQDNLIRHASYPVIFLFVFLMISKFMGSFADEGGIIGSIFGSIADASLQGTNGIQAFGITLAQIAIRVGLVVVMFYFAVKASDTVSVWGANFAQRVGNNVVFGGTSLVGRGILGGGATLITRNLNNSWKPPSGLGKLTKGTLINIAKPVASASFDPRAAKVPFSERVFGASISLDKTSEKLGFGKPVGKGGFEGYLHGIEEANKKKGEAKAKGLQHENLQAEIKEQEKFRKEFPGGEKAFDARIEELVHAISSLREKSTDLGRKSLILQNKSLELQRRQIELNARLAQATTDEQKNTVRQELAKLREEQNKQNEEAHPINDAIKLNKQSLKVNEGLLKALTSAGHNKVDAHNKEHAQEVAVKLVRSKNVVNYIAGTKILSGKSNKEKLAELNKSIAQEEKDEAGEDHADNKGHKEDSHGTGTSQPPPRPAPAGGPAGHADDHGHGGGGAAHH